MKDLNQLILTGRLTKDLELKYTPNGTAVAEGSIAVNRQYKEQEKTTFVNFTVWGKQAEVLAEYTKKGSALLLTGSIEVDSWDGPNGKQYKTYMRVDDFKFLDKKES